MWSGYLIKECPREAELFVWIRYDNYFLNPSKHGSKIGHFIGKSKEKTLNFKLCQIQKIINPVIPTRDQD